ncbi:hypothetical protein O6H91_02G013000 [Diphasiastrum complanatum]|uniref:Uncharacterized protein n=1 Tax=Diphasiastrum complanatum TaxID=34168 RepID=A0ACC2ECP8_DIPCM|nr:hypothetical protein O6H91_02G013000 [Diphasiastrum complanatum]
MRTRGSKKTTTYSRGGGRTTSKAAAAAAAAAAQEIPAAELETGCKNPTKPQEVADDHENLLNFSIDQTEATEAVVESKEEDSHVDVEKNNPDEAGKHGDSDIKSVDASEAQSGVAFSDGVKSHSDLEDTSETLQTGYDTEKTDAIESSEVANEMLMGANLEEKKTEGSFEEVAEPKETSADLKAEHDEIVQPMDTDSIVLSTISEGNGKETLLKSVEEVENTSVAAILSDEKQILGLEKQEMVAGDNIIASKVEEIKEAKQILGSEKQEMVAGENIIASTVEEIKEARDSDTQCQSEPILEQEVINDAEIVEAHEDLHQAIAGQKESEATNGEKLQEIETEETFTSDEKAVQMDVTETAQKGEDEFEAQHAMPISERRKQKKLEVFVGGLDKEVTEEELRNVFQKVGDVTEIRLMVNSHTGKNKGYAFVRYANAAQAKRATEELEHVQIRGRTCGVLQSEENDVLFLGNISKDWRKETISEALAKYEIEALEEVTLMEDPQNEGMNRGFAFLEFATHKDALKAFKQLQKPDVVFGTERSAKVSWAQPLNEPDEEVMAQVKSVFVDGMPPTWDEEQVKERFGKFGEIERIMLARNMSSAKRKDFGFINYSSRDAALACIEALNNTEIAEGETKVKLKVMLAKPQSKSRSVKGGARGGFHLGQETGRGRGGSLGRMGQGGRGFTRGGARDNYFSSRGVSDYNARASSLQQLFQAVKERAYEEERQLAAQRTALWGSGGAISAGDRVKNVLPARKESFHIGQEDRSRKTSNIGRGFGAQGAGQFGNQVSYRERFDIDAANPRVNAGRKDAVAPVSAHFGRPVHGYAAPAPASKRPYSAVDDGRKYADRQTRARLEPTEPIPFGVGSSQYGSGSFYDRTSVGRSQYSGTVGHGPTSLNSVPGSNVTAPGQQHSYGVYEKQQQTAGRGGNTFYAPGGHGYERDYPLESTIRGGSEIGSNKDPSQQARRQGTTGTGSD